MDMFLCKLVSRAQGSSKMWFSTSSFDGDNDEGRTSEVEHVHDDFIPEKRESIAQGVDPSKGWNFRGVHKVLGVLFLRNSVVNLFEVLSAGFYYKTFSCPKEILNLELFLRIQFFVGLSGYCLFCNVLLIPLVCFACI